MKNISILVLLLGLAGCVSGVPRGLYEFSSVETRSVCNSSGECIVYEPDRQPAPEAP